MHHQKLKIELKPITLFVILFILSCGNQDLPMKTEFKGFELNGLVNSFCLYSFETEYPNRKIKKIDCRKLIESKNTLYETLMQLGIEDLNYYVLNKDGEITFDLQYVSDIKQNSISKYSYDEKGNNIRSSRSEFDQFEYSVTKNYFDEMNNLIKVEEFYNNDLSFRREYLYDDNDLRIEEKHFRENDSLFLQRFYEYDSNGQLIADVDNNGVMSSQYRYENENLIELIVFKNGGEIMSTKNWEFDSLGNCIKETTHDTWKDDYFSKKYEYDSLQNTIMVSLVDSNSVLKGTSSFKYDGESNLVSKEIYKLDSIGQIKEQINLYYNQNNDVVKKVKKVKYESGWQYDEIQIYYEYDENENEILRMNSEKIPFEFREIEYY